MKKPLSFIAILLIFIFCLPCFFGVVVRAAEGSVIINQFYGRAADFDVAVSNSFIELYNPTGSDINLNGWSLQYSAGMPKGVKDDVWHVLPLSGKTVKAHSSLLIVGKAAPFGKPSDKVTFDGSVRYVINNYDLEWDINISNRAVTLALVRNTDPLSPVITESEMEQVADLVGATNTYSEDGDRVLNWRGGFVDGISKQKSARRFFFQNTGNNRKDFEILDYRPTGMDAETLAEKRPRWSGDGAWGKDIVPYHERLAFSAEAGIYGAQFFLTLTTGYTGATIRYTTDGSDPTAASTAYTAPILIKDRTSEPNELANITAIVDGSYTPPSVNLVKGSVIKARVFGSGGTPLTGIAAKSYYVSLPDALSGYPILSVITERKNFFDPSIGIYARGTGSTANFGRRGSDWERPVHLEFIEPDGTVGFSQFAGVRINGAGTRGDPQKSLRFYARAEYDSDNTRFDYDMFNGGAKDLDGNGITSFKRFLARGGGNDAEMTMTRDVVGQSLAEGLNVPYMTGRGSVVFINGEFWGFYYIRERIDRHFIRDKYRLSGTEADNLYTITNIGFEPIAYLNGLWNSVPSLKWFRENTDLSDPVKYEQACAFIDIENYIDYFIIGTFVANTDWPSNNNDMWRYENGLDSAVPGAPLSPTDGRFRWSLKDLDFAIWTKKAADQVFWWRPGLGVEYDYDYIYRAIFDPNADHTLKRNDSWATLYMKRFVTNKDFADKFVNRYCDLLNTSLLPEVTVPKLKRELDGIAAAIPYQRDRWRIPRSNWRDFGDDIGAFFQNRGEYTLQHLKKNFKLGEPVTVTLTADADMGYIRLNSIDVKKGTAGVSDTASWSGTYFAGLPQVVTAVPGKGYVFEKFTVNGEDRGTNPLRFTVAEDTEIEVFFEKGEPDPPIPVDVINGSGGGDYYPGEDVTVTADIIPEARFSRWVITPDVEFLENTSVNTNTAKFIMPDEPVVAEAMFIYNTPPPTLPPIPPPTEPPTYERWEITGAEITGTNEIAVSVSGYGMGQAVLIAEALSGGRITGVTVKHIMQGGSIGLTVGTADAADEIRIMIWNDTENMTPLCRAYVRK